MGKGGDNDRLTYLTVHINVVDDSCADRITVYKYDTGGTSYTESINNWSSTKNRKVVIYTQWEDGTIKKDLDWSAAHEFGHCLGVKDFYNISDERKAYYDGDDYKSIFNNRRTKAQNVDVKKVLDAFRTNRYQEW